MRIYENEREGQIDFFKKFRVDYSKNVLIDNTDGVINGNLLEFKVNISDVSKTLFQAIKYLSKLRIKGNSIPKNILLISLNEYKCYLFDSNDYFKEIHEVYYGGASKNNDGFLVHTDCKEVIDYTSQIGQARIITLLKETEYTPIEIDENCIVGWAERYYRENPTAHKGDFLGDLEGEVKIIGEIRQPHHFKNHILPYKGKTNEKFKYLMDKLNDDLNKKNLGAFYTPTLYCEKAAELLRQAISRVPEGNDYVIIDRCAGTGNLESVLTDEELSHCIVSTYEYYEYKVLIERLGDKVRHVVPPIETEDTYDRGFVKTSNALSREYLENELIIQYVNNPNCTIIMYENPPYSEVQAIDRHKYRDGKAQASWKFDYIVAEMKKEIKGVATNDMANAFIWSAFKYYLRQTTDSYVVLSPVKYWKGQHIINKSFIDGYAFNRKHFHTNTDATIMCALWSNENEYINEIKIKALDIKNGELKSDGIISINRVYSLYSDVFYDTASHDDDVDDGIMVSYKGDEVLKDKGYVKRITNDNIVGYLRANSNGFDQPNLDSGLHTTGLYAGHGFFLRKYNYLEKLPIFSGSRYVSYNNKWTERSRIMKSADGSERYFEFIKTNDGKEMLLKNLFFTIFESQNHMRTLIGSNGHFYRNELCLDTTNGETIASKDLSKMKMNNTEKKIIEVWNKILEEAKKSKEYNPQFTYGLYQIKDELNTTYKNELGKTVYNYPMLNSHIKTIMELVKNYYLDEIVPFLFEYEFLK